MSPVVKGLIFAGIGVGMGLIMGLAVYWPLLGLSGGGVAASAHLKLKEWDE